jgi:type IV pilus assembly protein PilY1
MKSKHEGDKNDVFRKRILLLFCLSMILLFGNPVVFAAPGDSCGFFKVEDCDGNCVSLSQVYGLFGGGDLGDCDSYLNCAYFNYDGGDCTGGGVCYVDNDGDGYGDPAGSTTTADASGNCPAGYVDNPDDCNDNGDDIHPGATEICDDLDNDCNGQIDDGLETFTYYQDADGDGYGNPSASMEACGPPDNYVTDNTDCDDGNANIHPGAYDICGNGIDEDCDGSDRECGQTPSICADLADVPLETQVEAAPPLVMLLVDDSGSMDWSVLCPEENGLFGGYYHYYDVYPYWKSQWAGYNGIYYNPELDYTPWPDTGTAEYDDADMDDPRNHPHSSYNTRDLDDTFDSLDGVNVRWAHYYVWSSTENAPYLVNITGDNGSYDLDYYKVTDCDNGACSATYSEVDEFEEDSTPPADVVSGRTAAEERQNFANWYQYYRTRQLTAISALANVVNSVQEMKLGLHAINHNNGINMIAPRLVDDNRGVILDDLYQVGANDGTPLRRGLEDVGDYFADEIDGPYSSSADGGDCQQAYTIMMTDGYYNGYDPSVGNADGDNDSDYDGGEFGDNYDDTLADVAMYYYERDLNSDLADLVPTSPQDLATHQHMVTYSISFGLTGRYDPSEYPDCPASNCPPWPDVDEYDEDEDSITDLWHAAVNGRGEYMEAKNAQQLAYALVSALQDVSKREGSGASVAVNSHELRQGTRMYQGTYNSAGWTGDLKAYDINTDGSVETDPTWSAAEVLDTRVASSGHGDRDIYTMGASAGVAFTSDNIDSLTTYQQNDLGADETERTNLINFIRGDYSNDQNYSGGFRARMTRLGDIVHSQPVYVNGYLYVGGNDGMLHVFNASNGQEVFAYIPSFVYPNLRELANPDYSHRYFVDLTPFLAAVGDDTLLIGGLGKGGKGYFCLNIDIDNPGSFTAADVEWEYPDSGSSTDEKANMGYTFSEPTIVPTETAGRVLVFGNGYDSANARAVLYVLDPATGEILNMIDTGYGSPSPGDNNCNGLSTPVFVDANNNGRDDYAYAGDLRGNVWKFDISGAVDDWDVAYYSGDTPQPLFQARDSAGNPQPITTRLEVRGHCVRGNSGYIIIFGTGKFNSPGDFTDTSTQSVYGIWDWAAEWIEEGETGPDKFLGAFNDPNGGQLSNLNGHADLSGVGSQLTLLGQAHTGNTVSYDGKEWGFTTANDITWFNVERYLENPGAYGSDTETEGYHVGWTFALPNSGERVVADPILWQDYALIVSQEPADNMCTVGGEAYLTALHYCSGAAPEDPLFDTNDDDEVNDDDLLPPDGGEEEEPPGRIKLEDFITYSPTMVEDLLYFGPGERYKLDDDPSRVLFWRYLDLN